VLMCCGVPCSSICDGRPLKSAVIFVSWRVNKKCLTMIMILESLTLLIIFLFSDEA
jgi:hypothetical protein